MFALLGFPEVEFRALLDDRPAMRDEMLEHPLEGQRLRHAVDESKHVVVEGRLKLCVFVEIVQDGLRVRRALELDDDADIVRGLVPQVADALELLFVHQIRDARDEVRFVHAERDGGDDDARVFFTIIDYLGLAPHDDRPLAVRVCMLDVGLTERDAAERKIGTLYVAKQVFGRSLWVVYKMYGRAYDFAQVMRRDVGRHAHRDAKRAVEEEVRDGGRQYGRLLFRTVVVRDPVHRLFFKIGEEFLGKPRHLRFRIAVGSSGVPVDRTEVALPKHERVAG